MSENISTKELFDRFYEGRDINTVRKLRPQVDRPEVYEHERKLGKSLVDMNADELFDMVRSFNNNRMNDSSGYSVSYASYDQIASQYRSIFNYYIDNIRVIRNPWNEKCMRGMEASKRLAQDRDAITWNTIDNIIKKVYDEYEEGRAKYIECIMLLFYNGFSKAEEIALLKEDMIDFKHKQVRLYGRTIQLSDRCFELLETVHNMDTLLGWRGDYTMVTWQDGYFKYGIRPKEVETFNQRTLCDVASFINKKILVLVRQKFGVDINYRILYLLGFYDSMVNDCGRVCVNRIITSIRDSNDVKVLMNYARRYGMPVDSISQLKRSLRPFLS